MVKDALKIRCEIIHALHMYIATSVSIDSAVQFKHHYIILLHEINTAFTAEYMQ